MSTTTPTRWGDVEVRQEPLDRNRARITFEGPADGVVVLVGQAVGSTVQCYEHMFSVDSVRPLERGRLRIECTRNSYAGD